MDSLDLGWLHTLGELFKQLGSVLGPVGAALWWFWHIVKRQHRADALEVAEGQLDKFKADEFNPQLEQLYRVLQEHNTRIDHVERFDKEFGIVKTKLEHVDQKLDGLTETVKENALESEKQLTGAMTRLSEQRKEDMQIQLERADNLKELIEAKIK